ncbi:MAG: OmpA family protein [Anaeromyxobacter sp.]|nr:OmpA family protein [Anaeromyxobacter sp.]
MSRRHLAALGLLLLAGAARGQAPAPFALQTYQPPPPGDAFLTVAGTDVPGHKVPSAALVFSWATEPLVLRVDGAVPPGGRIVHRQFWAFLQGAVGLGDRFLLDASLPVALYQSGSRPLGELPQVASTALGDLRLGLRTPLPPLAFIDAAAFAGLWLPTGSKDAFASDGAARVQVGVSASGNLGAIGYGGELGLLWRDAQDLAVTRTGSAVTWAVAAAWKQGPWRIGPEAFGRWQWDGTVTSPAELLVGGHWTHGAFDTSLGLGTQLDRAPGTAPVRVLARVSWRQPPPPPPAPPPAPPPPPPPAPEPEPEPTPPPPAPEPVPVPPPPPDRDGDGIADPLDACPDQPGPASEDPARHGCPPPPPPPPPPPVPAPAPLVKLTAEKIEILQSIQFETGKDVIRPEGENVLRQVAEVLITHPELLKLRIEGHTDSKGAQELNVVLSRKRALAVERWLGEHGVEAGRLTAEGYGPHRPIDTNATPAGRSRNRRVEFRILEQR